MRFWSLIYTWILISLPTTWVTAQNLLVTKYGDTVRFAEDLIVNDNLSSNWKYVETKERRYKVSEVKYVMLGNVDYWNINNMLYKKVISGKLNVYALREADTVLRQDGSLRGRVYIQDENREKPKPLTVSLLKGLMQNNSDVLKDMRIKYHTRAGGIVLSILGIVGTSVSFLVVAISGIIYLYNESTGEEFTIGAIGMAAGLGLITSGVLINNKSKKVNLNPIYDYNAH